MTDEDALRTVQLRLARIARERSPAAALERKALKEARRLAKTLGPTASMDAYISLGYLHWFRYQALPERRGDEELRRCVELLVPCFLAEIEPIPELLPSIAVASVTPAADLLNQALDLPNPETIAAVIRLWRRIVAAVPDNYHEGQQNYRSLLGVALMRGFELQRDPALLEESITQFTKVRDAAAASGGSNPRHLYELASALLTRHNASGSERDLTDAAALLEQTVGVGPVEQAQPDVLFQLGLRLLQRFEQTQARNRLDSALAILRAALDATPLAQQATTDRVYALCRCLAARYERTGDARDLEEMITVARRGLVPDPEGIVASSLAHAHLMRFSSGGQPADVEEAVRLTAPLVEKLPHDTPGWPAQMHLWGSALHARYELAGDLNDLNAAVTAFRRCVQAQTSPLPLHLGSLGQTLRHRFERTGDGAALDEAVDLLRDAIGAMADDSTQAATFRSSLGLCLLDRYERTQDRVPLDDAIVLEGPRSFRTGTQ
ncbi:hypothetical protein ACIRP7_45450 [Streptomyces sp. NPDC102270]|uniref:hypothetical protein n=1 Tax=Streptomyces sp. NPDC102270 TaxID=3366150 RepID=UPI0038075951